MRKRILAISVCIVLVLMISFSAMAYSDTPLSFSATTLYGKRVSSANFKNYDLIMVNYWAEWCDPCVYELPFLQKISKTYKNVLLIGVWWGDDLDIAKETAEDAGVTYSLIPLEDYSLYQYLDVNSDGSCSIPQTCFFDRDGHQLDNAYVGSRSYETWEEIVTGYLAEINGGNEQPVTAVTLNKSKATLTRTSEKKKPTLQLKATAGPEGAEASFEWSSSDTTVAKVSQKGKVTALKAGTAVITCREKNSGIEATCKITVKNKLITKITLKKTKAAIKKGKTTQLKIKAIKPADAFNQSVKWKSSNKKVATVDANGKVTAKKEGTCVITCTAADGSKVYAECSITVE